MVKKIESIVTLTDDLDGTKADRTVSFTIDGTSYEIDLSKRNANAFEKVLAPYVAAARSIGRRRAQGARGTRRAKGGAPARRGGLATVREWARANGYEVSDRGRVPSAITDAYNAASH